MNTKTKIHLSKLETELVQNREWILTKHVIINKVYQLFGELLIIYKETLLQQTQSIVDFYKHSGGKISKGENYQGLPYLILDHPRVFEKDNILAIRTMFWWGNFFSVTLHLSGHYKKKFEETIMSAYSFLKENEFFTCINPGQWEHHFEASNYVETRRLSQSEFEKGIRFSPFVKIANNISLENWEQAERSLLNYFQAMIGLLI